METRVILGERPTEEGIASLIGYVRFYAGKNSEPPVKKPYDGMGYDLSPNAALRLIGKDTAPIFASGESETHFGYLAVRAAVEANPGLKCRTESRDGKRTLVVREQSEAWNSKGNRMYEEGKQATVLLEQMGFDRHAVKAAKHYFGNHGAVEYCREIEAEGLVSALTPGVVVASANFARAKGMPLVAAVHYATCLMERNPCSFGSVDPSEIWQDHEANAEMAREIRNMDIDDLIELAAADPDIIN